MTIHEHSESFAGLPVKVYEDGKGLSSPSRFAWALTLGEEAFDAPEPLAALIGRFVREKGIDPRGVLLDLEERAVRAPPLQKSACPHAVNRVFTR